MSDAATPTRAFLICCANSRAGWRWPVSLRTVYELPMTQEQLADATGLTPVHVNRVLKGLEREGLIRRDRRFVTIPDWEALRQAGGFSETYLHLDQVPRDLALPG